MLPTLSVVIPTFNRSALVSSCVDSVIGMGIPNTEIIVVDDGSTDDTKEALARFGSAITYIRQANAGPSAARNTGAAASHGEILAFLDSDDHWIAGGPQALLNALISHPELPAVFADANVGNEHDGYRSFVEMFGGSEFRSLLGVQIASGLVWCRQWDLFRQLLVRNVIFPGSLFWRRSFFVKLGGFDAAIPVAEDWELSMRLVASFNVAYYTGGPVSVYNWHPGDRLTKDEQAMAAGYITAIESLLRKTTLGPSEHAFATEMLGQHYANRAHAEFVAGDLRMARQYYADWLKRFGPNSSIAARWALSHLPRPILDGLRHRRRRLTSDSES